MATGEIAPTTPNGTLFRRDGGLGADTAAPRSCYHLATISSGRGRFQPVSSSGFFLSGEGLGSGETLGDSPSGSFGTKRSEVRILSPRPE